MSAITTPVVFLQLSLLKSPLSSSARFNSTVSSRGSIHGLSLLGLFIYKYLADASFITISCRITDTDFVSGCLLMCLHIIDIVYIRTSSTHSMYYAIIQYMQYTQYTQCILYIQYMQYVQYIQYINGYTQLIHQINCN